MKYIDVSDVQNFRLPKKEVEQTHYCLNNESYAVVFLRKFK